MPPAPPAEKMRVAASPARLIWSEAFRFSRRVTCSVAPADDAVEEHHVGEEARDGRADATTTQYHLALSIRSRLPSRPTTCGNRT